MFLTAEVSGKKVLVAQLCPTLCDTMDCSLPGSSVHGILQARTLECGAISFSGDLPNPGMKPGSPALQADSLPFEPLGKPHFICIIRYIINDTYMLQIIYIYISREILLFYR